MEPFCRERSLELGEPIAGSAVANVDRWILLQYQGSWAPKAYPQAELPPAARQHLDSALQKTPRSRIQLIRRPDHRPTAGLALYVVRVERDASEVVAFRLSSYEALVGVDLVGLLAGTSDAPKPLRSRPLYLVCTHGTRDRCCAKWGVAVYDALHDALGEGVWQSDHLGGHRFAANVLALPDGLAFGRLTAEDVPSFAAARERGELPRLASYRGRCAYDAAEQAAEWYLLEELGRQDPDAFALVESGPTGGDAWTCVFEAQGGGARYPITVEERHLGELAKGCGKDAVPAMGWVRG